MRRCPHAACKQASGINSRTLSRSLLVSSSQHSSKLGGRVAIWPGRRGRACVPLARSPGAGSGGGGAGGARTLARAPVAGLQRRRRRGWRRPHARSRASAGGFGGGHGASAPARAVQGPAAATSQRKVRSPVGRGGRGGGLSRPTRPRPRRRGLLVRANGGRAAQICASVDGRDGCSGGLKRPARPRLRRRPVKACSSARAATSDGLDLRPACPRWQSRWLWRRLIKACSSTPAAAAC